MFKSIIKEFTILLLLLIAVTLLFAIIFYDYNPLNKTIPQKVETYTLPEEVETELANSLNNKYEKIVKTYQIDGTDLSKYEKQNEYNPGKIEPYSLQNITATDGGQTTTNNISENTQTNTSGGVFFNIVGK